MSKKLVAFVRASCTGAFVFALMNVAFRADISALAFPVSLVCLKFLLKRTRGIGASGRW